MNLFSFINFFKSKKGIDFLKLHKELSESKLIDIDINKSYQYFNEPFEHILCENFFLNFNKLNFSFPKYKDMSSPIRMHGDLTFPDKNYIDLVKNNYEYGILHNWVYSKNFIKYFLNIFKEDIIKRFQNKELIYNPLKVDIRPEPYEVRGNILSRKNQSNELFLFPRIDIGVGLKKYGEVNGGRGPHIDNLTRLISIMIYFTNQKDIEGGEFRMYTINNEYNYVINKTIPIKENLLLASLQSNYAFHDVNPLVRGERKAMYLSISCSKKIWSDFKDDKLKFLSKNRK